MQVIITNESLQSDFRRRIETQINQNLAECYQCGECSAGCPICTEMDYPPHQIIRFIQLGLEEQVLSSRTIWLCASCQTCTTRCPKGIEVAEVMDAVRNIAVAQGFPPQEKDVALAQRIFIHDIKRFGRQFELGLIGEYNLRSGHLFKDVALGPKLFFKGKIKLFPSRNKNIKAIFKKIKKLRAERAQSNIVER